MQHSPFDEVRTHVSKGTWDAKIADRMGFAFCPRSEIPAGETITALVLGAGPAGFGFVKQLIDRRVLRPSSERPKSVSGSPRTHGSWSA